MNFYQEGQVAALEKLGFAAAKNLATSTGQGLKNLFTGLKPEQRALLTQLGVGAGVGGTGGAVAGHALDTPGGALGGALVGAAGGALGGRAVGAGMQRRAVGKVQNYMREIKPALAQLNPTQRTAYLRDAQRITREARGRAFPVLHDMRGAPTHGPRKGPPGGVWLDLGGNQTRVPPFQG